MPDLNGLAQRLVEKVKEENLYYSEDLLRGIEIALGVPRRFVIFYGPPGVGKTRLVQAIAAAMPAELSIVPVDAGWRDGSALLGTYDPVRGCFLPGELAVFAARAAAAPEKNFAFCLEELSQGDPGGYLAPLLCGLDLEPPRLRLVFPGEGDAAREIPIPDNLFLFGTVFQEAGKAKPLPRKLLDCAALFELDYAGLDQFLSVWNRPFPGREPLAEVIDLLHSNGIIIGYRVVREISTVLSNAARVGLDQDRLLDQQMRARILPAVQGNADTVEAALRALVKYLTQDELRFPETLDKAVRMLEQLELYGYTAAYIT